MWQGILVISQVPFFQFFHSFPSSSATVKKTFKHSPSFYLSATVTSPSLPLSPVTAITCVRPSPPPVFWLFFFFKYTPARQITPPSPFWIFGRLRSGPDISPVTTTVLELTLFLVLRFISLGGTTLWWDERRTKEGAAGVKRLTKTTTVTELVGQRWPRSETKGWEIIVSFVVAGIKKLGRRRWWWALEWGREERMGAEIERQRGTLSICFYFFYLLFFWAVIIYCFLLAYGGVE